MSTADPQAEALALAIQALEDIVNPVQRYRRLHPTATVPDVVLWATLNHANPKRVIAFQALCRVRNLVPESPPCPRQPPT
jgi:hypothetical protein